MSNLVVARFADGRTVKGTSLDVDSLRPQCHVRTANGEMIEITLAELKALFFVRSIDGNSAHVEGRDIRLTDPRLRGARLIEVGFRDGEKVVGLATRYPPNKKFFFLVPVDSASNNLRVLVNAAQIEWMTPVEPPATK